VNIANMGVGTTEQPGMAMMVIATATDVPPSRWMLVVKNDDTPGAIGRVTTALGDAGVNIANMGVGTTEQPGMAMMVIATATEVPTDTIAVLRGLAGIGDVQQVAG
jgi:acetolactate synthase small subunit